MAPRAPNHWDYRYLAMAQLVASWSRDPSTQCGAVIVRPDKTVAAVGFNGFPRGADDSPALYADRARKYERILHAELNAILTAHGATAGATIYVWPFMTCARCAAAIIQAGIRTVVVLKPKGVLAGDRWLASWAEASALYGECGIEVLEVPEEEWQKATNVEYC